MQLTGETRYYAAAEVRHGDRIPAEGLPEDYFITESNGRWHAGWYERWPDGLLRGAQGLTTIPGDNGGLSLLFDSAEDARRACWLDSFAYNVVFE